MPEPSERHPSKPVSYDEIPTRTILGVIAFAAIFFGVFNFVGDVVLFNRDAPMSEGVWDAAWHSLLLFVALLLWAAVDRWRTRRTGQPEGRPERPGPD
jgi:hypothetical protein